MYSPNAAATAWPLPLSGCHALTPSCYGVDLNVPEKCNFLGDPHYKPQLPTPAPWNAWEPSQPSIVYDPPACRLEAAPVHYFHSRPHSRNSGASASHKSSLDTPYGNDLSGFCPKLHDEISTIQEYGIKDTLYKDFRTPVAHNNAHTWELNNDISGMRLSGTIATDLFSIAQSNSFDTGAQSSPHDTNQDFDYPNPFSEHNVNRGTYNTSANGTQCLDILSLDVGQAAFEKLMAESNVFQESSSSFSSLPGQSVATDFSLNPGPLFQPIHGAFDLAEWQSLPVQQMSEQEYQDQVQLGQEQPSISTQPTAPQQPPTSLPFPCTFGNCARSFKRKSDRARHCKTVHGVNYVKYFCPILGCSKSQGHGQGYSRDDKVTENLWHKHGDLGFTKST